MSGFMEAARAEALTGLAAGEGGPFGAAVVRNGQVIATAHNTVLKDNDSTAHAEVNAIRLAERLLRTFDLAGCELYTTCYPCPMCLGAILWARIDRVYYGCSSEDAAGIGFDDRRFYDLMSTAAGGGVPGLVQMEREECREVFRRWAEMEDKRVY
ncbi:MAG: nucleoside deaminase [Firmicutes bacterium]|nr:nucleoside deaminase [Bacillota bacterium]